MSLPSTSRLPSLQQSRFFSARLPPCRSSTQRPRHAARMAPPPPASSMVPLAETVESRDHDNQPHRTNLDALVARFRSFDQDGNGKIDREELRQLLESVDGGTTVLLTQQHWLPEAELDRVMQTYDKDANGYIDFEEFQNIVYDGLLLDGMLSEYEEAFNAVDVSGNGTVGAMELQKLFEQLGNPMSYEKLSDLMLQYDRDETGQIEFGEFLLMFRDQLLDLKEMQVYMESAAQSDGEKSNSYLNDSEGAIRLLFSKQELDEALAVKDKITVVFCAMTWCRPCKFMQRPAAKLAAAYKDGVNFVKMFGNSNAQTKKIFQSVLKVGATPSFMIYDNMRLVYTQQGKNQGKLEDALRAHMDQERLPKKRVFPSPAQKEEAQAAAAAAEAAQQ